MSSGEVPTRVHKRPRGTGSIYAHDGGWRVRIRENGRERSWLLPTYAAAAELLKEIRIQREEGTPMRRLDKQRPTVSEWLDEWLAQLALSRPRTYPFYSQKLAHVRPLLGSIPLDELDARDVRKTLTDLEAAGMSSTMLHHVYRSLSAALNAATKERRIARNPCADVAAPKRGEFEAQTLTPEQAQRLVELAWETRLGPLITVALSTGMRAGELMALTWDDVDLKAGLLTVNKSVKWLSGGAHQVGSTKTRSSRRTVRVEGLAVAALAEQRHRCVEARLAGIADHNLVFPSVHGTYWIPSGRFVRDFRALLSRAGCPKIRFHDLRHTAGVFMTRSVGLVVTSRVLGHSHPSVTATFYGHAQQEDYTAAARAMSSLLGGTTGEGRTIPFSQHVERDR
ncbi:MAG: site-specific integrase [Candidatus Dormibacteria bacterium]